MSSSWFATAFVLMAVVVLAVSPTVLASDDVAVTAIASLTDPQKLATLQSERAANDRLLKCVYWLNYARSKGNDPASIIDQAQLLTGASSAHASLVKQGLLRNQDIAEKLGCLTPENLERLRRGYSPTVTKGPYRGEKAEVDHIIPVSVVPELGNEMANLELMPRTLNRRKSNAMGQRQRDYLRKFKAAGVLSMHPLAR